MIISRTPYRISFFGGGTDYPAWFREHGGSVLAASIDKYCYLSCRYLPPFFDHRFRVVWSKNETVQCIDDITHPAVREVLKYMNIQRGLEIHHDGDLPARSGMGSSSSFMVGLLHVLHALHGTLKSKSDLAEEAIHIEQNIMQEVVGSQDQVTAAHGGFNRIEFLKNGETVLTPLPVPKERLDALNDHILLVYTAVKRTASNVAGSYAGQQEVKRNSASLHTMKQMVDHAVKLLTSGAELHEFGELLHEAWLLKRSLSPLISNPAVEEIYETARAAGAIGGKVMGAGGGGFMMFFAPPESHEIIRERLGELICVPVRFEHSGSQIIFYDRERDYLAEEEFRNGREIRPFQEWNPPPEHGTQTSNTFRK